MFDILHAMKYVNNEIITERANGFEMALAIDDILIVSITRFA